MINPLILEFNEDGTLNQDSLGAEYGNSAVTRSQWFGNEGDDIMFGRKRPQMEMQFFGGAGDDTLYGSYRPNKNQVLAGEGGKDLIRTDIYKSGENKRATIVFGDYGYGAEGARYLYGDSQYGEMFYEAGQAGDDDIIIFGDADGTFSSQ